MNPLAYAFAGFRLLLLFTTLTILGHVLFAPASAGVIGWGENFHNQTTIPSSLEDTVAIAAGGYHSLALRADGTVVAWGAGDPFGFSNFGQVNVPGGLRNAVGVAAGEFHSLALRADGTVVAWGWNIDGQARVPAGLSNAVAIAANGWHSLALTVDGRVVGWGSREPSRMIPSGLSNVVAIAVGGFHSLALRADGTVIGWGRNDDGQAAIPLGLSNVVAIAGGQFHSLALKADGQVLAWGRSDFAQTTIPSTLSNVTAIAAGYDHNLALTAEGKLIGWGSNEYGQATVPTGLTNVLAIAGGNYHSLALVVGSPRPHLLPGIARIRAPIRSGEILLGDSLQFSGAGAILDSFRVPGYSWTFGDGRMSVSQLPGLVNFPSVGEWLVSFALTANRGQWQTPPATILIRVVAPLNGSPDLAADRLDVPSDLAIGQLAQISYVVHNIGDADIVGQSWNDALYLSSDPYLDTDDRRVTSMNVATAVPVGGAYTNTFVITIPPVPEGAYHLLLSVDDEWQVLERHQLNNELARPTDFLVPRLSDGVAVSGQLNARADTRYYRIDVPQGQNLVVTLDDANNSGHNELYMRRGQLPTRSEYDARYSANLAAYQRVVVPSAPAGTYYILVYAESVPDAPGNFTLTATLPQFTILDLEPNQGGNRGQVTVKLSGVGFKDGDAVALVSPSNPVVWAFQTNVVNETEMWASFDLAGATTGGYTVRLSRTGGSVSLTDSFTVVEGGAADFWLNLLMPSATRPGQESVFWVEFANRGLADAPAPVIELILPLGMVASTVSGGWLSKNLMQLPGIAAHVPRPVLPPGSRSRIPIHFRSSALGSHTVLAHTYALTDLDTRARAIDWTTIEQRVRPPAADPALWQAQWSELTGRAGSTFGEYSDRYLAYAVSSLAREERWRTAAEWLLFGSSGAEEMPELLRLPRGRLQFLAGQRGTLIQAGRLGNWTLELLQPVYMQGGSWTGGYRLGLDTATNWFFSPGTDLGGFSEADTVYEPRWEVKKLDGTLEDVIVGAQFELKYASPTVDEGTQWVQVIWARGDRKLDDEPHLDPRLQDECVTDNEPFYTDNEPFYYDSEFDPTPCVSWIGGLDRKGKIRVIGSYLRFLDIPAWSLAGIHQEWGDDFAWTAELHLVEFRDNSVKIHQGYIWGWRVRKVSDGSGDPTPPGPGVGSPYRGTIRVVSSIDPNEKIGPAAFGLNRFVPSDALFPYTIRFENDTNAAASAQIVDITDTLDPNLDLSTFELGTIAFGSHVVTVPGDRTHYATTVDLRPQGTSLIVEIEAGLNSETRTASWTLRSLDPATRLLPDNPLAGFLPPNDKTHRGEGHVSFVVRPKAYTPTGTEIRNVAKISFDFQPTIATDWADPHDASKGVDTNKQALVTIDADLPSSEVGTLPDKSASPFVVSWSGSDNGAGIVGYDVYVQINDDPWVLWLANTRETHATFQGQLNQRYRFRSVARDGSGNLQPAADAAQAETIVDRMGPLRPEIVAAEFVGGQFQIQWTAVADQAYVIESTDNLDATPWKKEGTVTAIGDLAIWSDPAPTSVHRFYRIRLP
ncbi:MAG: hypothetical protein L0Z50_12715 [Verrucomicrobiales bacterium]|nr:hypothetical protein [Verrucomicrobiales bacterium]